VTLRARPEVEGRRLGNRRGIERVIGWVGGWEGGGLRVAGAQRSANMLNTPRPPIPESSSSLSPPGGWGGGGGSPGEANEMTPGRVVATEGLKVVVVVVVVGTSSELRDWMEGCEVNASFYTVDAVLLSIKNTVTTYYCYQNQLCCLSFCKQEMCVCGIGAEH